MTASPEKQVGKEKLDHARQAEFAAGFLVDGPGDVRNDGAVAYALTAQVHASLAIVERLEDLVHQLEELNVRLDRG